MKKNSSNFNKLFATTAIATAAIVVPVAIAGAEEVKEVPVEKISELIKVHKVNGETPKINYTIEVDAKKIPPRHITEKYEWYYVETVDGVEKEFIIQDATSKTLKVPLEALGKSIQVKVTAHEIDANDKPVKDDAGNIKKKVFVADQPHEVNKINITMDPISLVGIDVEQAATVGDVITVGEIVLKDSDTQKVLPVENNQIKYTFEWYEKDENNYSIISGATARSFKITPATKDKTILAKVSFELNGETYSNYTDSFDLSGNLDRIALLNKDIDDLIIYSTVQDQDVYEIGDYSKFSEDINNLLKRYNALAEGAKAQITNADILKDAEKNIGIINEFVKEIEAAKVKIPSDDMLNQLTESQINNLEKIQLSLQTKYDALDSLQHSLLKVMNEVNYDELMTVLSDVLENRQYNVVFEKVKEINNEIIGLFNVNLDLSTSPIVVDSLRSAYNESLAEVSSKIASINKEISKLDKNYKPFVYTNLVKQIDADVKKAEAVDKKITKISEAKLDKKKATASAAYKAYIALTPLQKSLISEERFALIKAGIDIELDDKLLELNENIVDYLFGGASDSYDAYEVNDLSSAQGETDALLATYKMLTSAEKKFITNYHYLTTAQKDIKAALNVNKLFEEAETLESNIGGNTEKEELSATEKAISKYKSAISAHAKLTKMQQSLISDISLNNTLATYGDLVIAAYELEIAIKLDKNPDLDIEKPDFSLNSSIAALISSDKLSYTGTIPNFQKTVNELLQKYKELPSKDRKAIYNYSTLTKASSDIKKAASVLSKLQAAANANDQKKYQSALDSYKKLTSLQQSLIDFSDINTDGMEGINEIVGEVEEAINDLRGLIVNGTVLLEDIESVNLQYNKLTSSQKKLVSNYTILKDILKDVSAVKSFVSKLDKLGFNPTFSKKESILQSYYKLSTTQVKLFKDNYSDGGAYQSPVDRLIAYEADVYNKTNTAKQLNEKINSIVDKNTTYPTLAELNEKVAQIDAEYLALPSADQKLITNYSKLNTVKKDIEAVTKAIELEELKNEEAKKDPTSATAINAEKDWKKAYNRLNSRQMGLYNNR
ncbi:hypothetical protein CSE16_16345 [Solibacillus sp. R5-41]|uniref:hypothetical protein n=1 Tax=Solibacillus sp. R5-41 TaxID=2048654 RepID=UPI000C1286F0|nr:hypothetical protein [Solibacillus sp. R5-41]ATP41510.1 hypothetical protein CSE16_16345 [Solibacillus sp. R5-41]